MLTRQARKTYLEGGGVHCPFCSSEDIEGGHLEVDAGFCTQRISCLVCHRSWWDTYKLVGVEEIKEEAPGSPPLTACHNRANVLSSLNQSLPYRRGISPSRRLPRRWA